MNREQAWALLTQYDQEPFHLRHAITVEHVLAWYACQLGYGDQEEHWAVVGLLHDLDFEKWPEEHLKVAPRLLAEAGYDEAFIHAVAAHGYGLCTDVKPALYMEKFLYTIDELTGLITATAYMRPSRSVMDMEVKSVKKKFKDKGFAAGVSRDVILAGCDMLGMTLDEVIAETIAGMRDVHEALGL